MYFGSVRFFKHVILGGLALMILVPVCLCVALGVRAHRASAAAEDANERAQQLSEQLEALQGQLQALQAQLHAQQDAAAPQQSPAQEAPPPAEVELYNYQALYPQLYAPARAAQDYAQDDRTIYLTFDDGPSARTDEILDLLAEYDIKATFFVVGHEDEASWERMRRIVQEGHTLGIHTYSHSYSQIYASVESYLEDFERMYRQIEEVTGTPPEIFRFAGGSLNSYDQGIYHELIAEMVRRGFTFFDWNLSAQDATAGISAARIADNVLQDIGEKNRGIVLMHDDANRYQTVEALPAIIDELLARGYRFDRLSNEVRPIVFAYTD